MAMLNDQRVSKNMKEGLSNVTIEFFCEKEDGMNVEGQAAHNKPIGNRVWECFTSRDRVTLPRNVISKRQISLRLAGWIDRVLGSEAR